MYFVLNGKEVQFYGYISTLGRPDVFANRYEEKAYNEACEKFATFNNVHDVVLKIGEFNTEVRYLYNLVERSISNSNFFSHKETTGEVEPL